jgi:hypothetical protein
LAAAACSKPPDVPASRIVGERVIGVQSNPAEVGAGDTVSWTAIVASPDGFVKKGHIDWSMCMRPRGPSDPITVSPACLGEPENLPPVPDGGTPLGPALVDLDSHGLSVEGDVSIDACTLLGSEVPTMDLNGNVQRPPDADVTGGYQMAVRLLLQLKHGHDESFARQRIHCRLNSAPGDVAQEYAARYVLNENPGVHSVSVDGHELRASGTPPSIDVTKRDLTLVAHWRESARETYLLFDPISHKLVDRDELLEVAWFTDAGEFDVDRTNPDGVNEDKSHSTNVLHIDPKKTTAHVWVLLRDDRGGMGYELLTIHVK